MTVYCGIAADINNNLETFYYIKIGKTFDGYALDRCDRQRVKYVWDIPTFCEKVLLDFARTIISPAYFDYRPAGYTESFGNFKSAKDAINMAFNILEAIKNKYNVTHNIHRIAKQYTERVNNAPTHQYLLL